MSVSKTVKFQFFKVQVSRFVRGTIRKISDKFSKDTAGSPSNVFGEDYVPVKEDNRGKKVKSTAIVLVSGVAIGISHVTAISAKYGVKSSPRFAVITGLVTGVTSAYIWFNYVDAAVDPVNEEDIEMMFEMAAGSGLGRDYNDSDEGGKAFDILHSILTGDELEHAEKDITFKYEDEDEDEDEDREKDDAKDPFRQDKVDFSESSTKHEDTGSPFSTGNRSRSMGIGKPLHKRESRNPTRNSMIPELDRDGEDDEKGEVKQVKENWMDF